LNLKIVRFRHRMSFRLGVEVRLQSNYVVAWTVAGLAALTLMIPGKPCLAPCPALHNRSMLAMRQRPARNFILRASQTFSFRRM